MGLKNGAKREVNSAAELTPVAALPAASRSAKTNDRRQFLSGDGRSVWARRLRDLESLYADDLGGASALSEFQLGLISTCATLRCELEKMEGRLSVGEPVDLDQFGRLVGHYRRCCETLGVERRKRDVTPSVDAYLAHVAAGEKADAA
jgi:hypothetical protein